MAPILVAGDDVRPSAMVNRDPKPIATNTTMLTNFAFVPHLLSAQFLGSSGVGSGISEGVAPRAVARTKIASKSVFNMELPNQTKGSYGTHSHPHLPWLGTALRASVG